MQKIGGSNPGEFVNFAGSLGTARIGIPNGTLTVKMLLEQLRRIRHLPQE